MKSNLRFALLLLVLILKLLIEWRFARKILGFFGNGKLMNYFILFQPLHVFYVVASGFLSVFGFYTWKGRTVK